MSASEFSTQLITRRDCIEQLPEGSDPLVVELHLAATAGERHASRVARAIEVARRHLESRLTEVADRMVGTLLALEVGGVGGRLGYRSDTEETLAGETSSSEASTARMGWARGLGKGRRGATDGEAWTSAITHAGASLGCEAPTPTPDDIRCILPAITGDDFEWPLAYALRQARAWCHDVACAAGWAQLAREVAARCEPDTRAGRLAHRYQLRTLDPQVAYRGNLTAEVIADMLGVGEADLLARIDGSADALITETSGPLTIVIHAAEELCRPVESPDDRLFRVDVSTRDASASEVDDAMHRTWLSAGLSMHSDAVAEVARMCREIQPWAMAPEQRWPVRVVQLRRRLE